MKWKLFLAWVLSYAYVLIKYTIYDTSSKFDSTGASLIISFIYFLPLGLFALSSFLFAKQWVGPKVRYGVIFLMAAGLAVAGGYIGYSFYDDYEFWPDYFMHLNDGYTQPVAEDLRLEYFIVFLLNICCAIVFLIRRMKGIKAGTTEE